MRRIRSTFITSSRAYTTVRSFTSSIRAEPPARSGPTAGWASTSAPISRSPTRSAARFWRPVWRIASSSRARRAASKRPHPVLTKLLRRRCDRGAGEVERQNVGRLATRERHASSAPLAQADAVSEAAAWESDTSDRFQSVTRWRGEPTPKGPNGGAALDQEPLGAGRRIWRFAAPGWPERGTELRWGDRRQEAAWAWAAGREMISSLT